MGDKLDTGRMTGDKFFKHMEEARTRRAASMPTVEDCLRAVTEASHRLRELGWNDAIYCPKDGTKFDAIEFGSSTVHPCHYEGVWPSGSWWVSDGMDLWPSYPVMFRARAQSPDSPHG